MYAIDIYIIISKKSLAFVERFRIFNSVHSFKKQRTKRKQLGTKKSLIITHLFQNVLLTTLYIGIISFI